MTYLEQLKKAVADAFKDASDKSAVDNMVQIQAAIDGVEQENTDLVKKNHELLTAYKEAVAHPGITTEKAPDVTTVEAPAKMPTFEDFLQANLKK